MSELFNEEDDPQSEAGPTLAEVIKDAVDAKIMDMRTAMPGIITAYDKASQTATVQPVFKRKYGDGTTGDPPQIYKVPIAHPRAGDAFIHLPVAVGHTVLLVFSDRSLEKWMASGKVNDPEDNRAHHMSDAIAIPGGYASATAANVHNSEDIIIKNGNGVEIRVKTNGHLEVRNSSQELIKILDEWISADIAGAHGWLLRIRTKLRTFLEK